MNKPIRKDPLGLIAAQTPAAVTAAAPTRTAETARQNNTVVGACPVCQARMQVVNAGGNLAYVCMEHCVCLPTQD